MFVLVLRLCKDFFPGCGLLSLLSTPCFSLQFQGTELHGRCPVSHFWDESDPRLFVCETVPISSESSSASYVDMVKTVTNIEIDLYNFMSNVWGLTAQQYVVCVNQEGYILLIL